MHWGSFSKNIAKMQYVMLIHLRSAEADNPTEQSPGLLTSVNQMHLKESKTLNLCIEGVFPVSR